MSVGHRGYNRRVQYGIIIPNQCPGKDAEIVGERVDGEIYGRAGVDVVIEQGACIVLRIPLATDQPVGRVMLLIYRVFVKFNAEDSRQRRFSML